MTTDELGIKNSINDEPESITNDITDQYRQVGLVID